MPKFLDPLELEYIDGHNWKITQPFEYETKVLKGKCVLIVVPAGFITDFASIPRGLWNILPPTGKYGKAAVIHDYLYRGGMLGVFNRGQVDSIFKEAMAVLGVGVFKRNVMYAAVRSFGWAAWKGK